ncbi:uncharacterized protein LOC132608248 [Lycium barbarum]|uniref:uncharacterized protein LOC132608248 n=1 Tax=Lycium barbarum TaxID=112863 RepID=UPI00293E862C|nr:uncharacterized protein LOC132608248 [Lycium barbarum]
METSVGQGTCNNNQGNYNNNYSGVNQGNYNNFRNKSFNPFIPPKGQSSDQDGSRLEDMLEKVLSNQTKAKKTLSGLTEIVGFHMASIQKLESQMRDMSREQHPPQKRGLPSDTIPNLKNGGGGVDRVYGISTRSSKILQEVPTKIPTMEEVADIPDGSKMTDDKSKQTLSLNFPFLDIVKEMTGFAKYLKDLITKKRSVQHETVSLTHTVSSIILTTTVQNKGDPGTFTIPCSIGCFDFARDLYDNGASINLMSLSIYKQSGLGMPGPMTMRLQMADRSIKRLVGVVDDVLVRGDLSLLPQRRLWIRRRMK